MQHFNKRDVQFAKFQAENLMKQLQESISIVNTTSNPQAFFGRLRFSLEVLLEMQRYEKYHVFRGSTPTSDYYKITSNLDTIVDKFIDRAVEANRKKLESYKTEAAKERNYRKFVEDLIDCFDVADSFWSGNTTYPKYNGKLYTSNNYQRVQKMYDDLFASSTQIISENEQNVPDDAPLTEIDTIDLMEGHDFEHWCASALENSGFTDVEVTPPSGDHGVDVLAQKDGIKYAIQCKRYSHDLGNTPVQEVHAGKSMYNCHVGVVITNQHFTTGAKQLAQATGVLLWDREWVLAHLNKDDSSSSVPDRIASEIPTHQAASGDDLLPDAVRIIEETGQASVSILQRRLNIGYARAARIVDEMEEKGIVGPFQGSKPREILIPHTIAPYSTDNFKDHRRKSIDISTLIKTLLKFFLAFALCGFVLVVSFFVFLILTAFISAIFNLPSSWSGFFIITSLAMSIIVMIVVVVKVHHKFTDAHSANPD